MLSRPALIDSHVPQVVREKDGRIAGGAWFHLEVVGEKGNPGPPFDLHRAITNAGVDLSLGCGRKAYNLTARRQLDFVGGFDGTHKAVVVQPGQTVSVQTRERLTLGRGLGGVLTSTVRTVSKGLSHVSTTLDPGWHGELMITMTNQGSQPVRIPVGEKIVTAVLFRIEHEPEDSFNADPAHNEQVWQAYIGEHLEQERRDRNWAILAVVATALLVIYAVWPYWGGIRSWFMAVAGELGVARSVIGIIAGVMTIAMSARKVYRWVKRSMGARRQQVVKSRNSQT